MYGRSLLLIHIILTLGKVTVEYFSAEVSLKIDCKKTVSDMNGLLARNENLWIQPSMPVLKPSRNKKGLMFVGMPVC